MSELLTTLATAEVRGLIANSWLSRIEQGQKQKAADFNRDRTALQYYASDNQVRADNYGNVEGWNIAQLPLTSRYISSAHSYLVYENPEIIVEQRRAYVGDLAVDLIPPFIDIVVDQERRQVELEYTQALERTRVAIQQGIEEKPIEPPWGENAEEYWRKRKLDWYAKYVGICQTLAGEVVRRRAKQAWNRAIEDAFFGHGFCEVIPTDNGLPSVVWRDADGVVLDPDGRQGLRSCQWVAVQEVIKHSTFVEDAENEYSLLSRSERQRVSTIRNEKGLRSDLPTVRLWHVYSKIGLGAPPESSEIWQRANEWKNALLAMGGEAKDEMYIHLVLAEGFTEGPVALGYWPARYDDEEFPLDECFFGYRSGSPWGKSPLSAWMPLQRYANWAATYMNCVARKVATLVTLIDDSLKPDDCATIQGDKPVVYVRAPNVAAGSLPVRCVEANPPVPAVITSMLRFALDQWDIGTGNVQFIQGHLPRVERTTGAAEMRQAAALNRIAPLIEAADDMYLSSAQKIVQVCRATVSRKTVEQIVGRELAQYWVDAESGAEAYRAMLLDSAAGDVVVVTSPQRARRSTVMERRRELFQMVQTILPMAIQVFQRQGNPELLNRTLKVWAEIADCPELAFNLPPPPPPPEPTPEQIAEAQARIEKIASDAARSRSQGMKAQAQARKMSAEAVMQEDENAFGTPVEIRDGQAIGADGRAIPGLEQDWGITGG